MTHCNVLLLSLQSSGKVMERQLMQHFYGMVRNYIVEFHLEGLR